MIQRFMDGQGLSEIFRAFRHVFHVILMIPLSAQGVVVISSEIIVISVLNSIVENFET